MHPVIVAAVLEISSEICDATRDIAMQWLEMGYSVDDLPVLLGPWVRGIAKMRAKHLARLEACGAHHGPVH